MTDSRDDRDLVEAFAALREVDESQAPDFARFLTGGRRPRPRRAVAGLGWATVGLAASIGAMVVLRSAPSPTSADAALTMADTLTAWSAPTDSLLEVEGLSAFEGVPDLKPTSFVLPEMPASDDGDVPRYGS